MATGIGAWDTTAANNDDADTDINWLEGQAASTVNNSARAMMSAVATWLRDGSWIQFKEHTHTYVSATSVKTSGVDTTAYYPKGRRVRAVGSSTGTIYGRIVSAAFSTDTTITIKWDSGSLSNETLAISVALAKKEAYGGDLTGVLNTAKATDVASASSCDIWTTNGNLVHVTGTTGITSFGTAPQAGCERTVIFDGALTITRDGTAIETTTGADLSMAAGSIALVVADTTTKAMVIPFQSGGYLQRAEATYTSNADLTTVLPLDDTIPQNTEGAQIISQAFTPKSASSRIRIRIQGMASTTIQAAASIALFVDTTADALAASATFISDAGNAYSLVLEYEEASASTSARTYKVRAGPSTGATMRMNGTTSGRLFGGVAATTLVIEEVA